MTTVKIHNKCPIIPLTPWDQIPDGDTFSGTVGTITGFFTKNRMGIVVIDGSSLNPTDKVKTFDNCWPKDYAKTYPVQNYVPVDVEITIKEPSGTR